MRHRTTSNVSMPTTLDAASSQCRTRNSSASVYIRQKDDILAGAIRHQQYLSSRRIRIIAKEPRLRSHKLFCDIRSRLKQEGMKYLISIEPRKPRSVGSHEKYQKRVLTGAESQSLFNHLSLLRVIKVPYSRLIGSELEFGD